MLAMLSFRIGGILRRWQRCLPKRAMAGGGAGHVVVRPISAVAAAGPSSSKLHARGSWPILQQLPSTLQKWQSGFVVTQQHDGLLGPRLMSSQRRGGEIPRMSDFESPGEMISAAHANLDAFSDRTVSAFWTEMEKHLRRRSVRLLKGNPNAAVQLEMILCHTLEAMQSNIDSFSPRDLAQTAIALAKIVKRIEDQVEGQRGRSSENSPPFHLLHGIFIGKESQNKQFIMKELAVTAMPMREEFPPRELSNVIYAFGLAKYVLLFDDGSSAFDVLAKEALSNLKKFNGQDFSNMLWAYANVEVSNPALFKASGDVIAARDGLESFWPQALANTVWAYATTEEPHPKLFEKVADHIVSLDLQSFSEQALANTVWAYATANECHLRLFKKVADHIVSLDSLRSFIPQHLSNIVWAYATANESHPALFKKVADHIVSRDDLSSFIPQHFSNTMWAYATANECHPKLFNRVADHIVSLDLRSFNPQNLANTVWAYATAKESHPELFNRVADHIVKLDSLGSFKPQHLANTLWAFATSKESHPELFNRVADHIATLDSLGSFIPQELSNTVWGFATAGITHPKLFQKVADAAMKRQSDFTAQGVANLLWAFASNGQLDRCLYESFAPTATNLLGKCKTQDLSNLAWAYAVANADAPALFNSAFISACIKEESEIEIEALRQLHQWNLWQEEMKSSTRLPPSLEKRCRDAFVSAAIRPSALQDGVVSELSSIGLNPEEEYLTERGYSLDALVKVNGSKVGVEVDGPSHFLGRQPTGSTLIKRRQVAALEGIPIVSVPYWEWDKLGRPGRNSKKKQHYLRSLLKLN